MPQVVGLHHVQLAMPPALLVDDLAGLRARPVEAGLPAADDTQLEGFTRFDAEDPFGIRLEFLQVSMIERRFKTGDRARWQLDRSRSERLRSAAMRRATAVTLAVVAAVLVAAPARAAPRCFGRPATIVGSPEASSWTALQAPT